MKYKSIITHLAAAIIITGIMLTIYATVQQVHRTNANDPQLQLARDISEFLHKGKLLTTLPPKDTIDISKSDGVFVILFDEKGNAISTTGLLDGKTPQLPVGVLDAAKLNNENAISWQPQPDVRIALVVESVLSPEVAYVAVGRSLKETELRITNLIWMVFIAWVLCIVVIVLHGIINFLAARKTFKIKQRNL